MPGKKKSKVEEDIDTLLVSEIEHAWAMKKTMGVGTNHEVCIEFYTESEAEYQRRVKTENFPRRRQTEQLFVRMEDKDIIMLQRMIGDGGVKPDAGGIKPMVEWLTCPLKPTIEDTGKTIRFVYDPKDPVNKERQVQSLKAIKEFKDKIKEGLKKEKEEIKRKMEELDKLEVQYQEHS